MKNTLLLLVCLMMSKAFSQKAIHLDGTGPYTGSYVSLGNDSALTTEDFTIECWFKRTAAGDVTPTGFGGAYAIPLVARGRAEAEVDSSTLDVDGDSRDMNYFLGIDVNGILIADFEEIASGTAPGLNHTIYGVTAVQNDHWNHACATYDGTTFRLYLNGRLETSAVIGRIPNYLSTQYSSIGTAIGSDGFAEGRFNGDIDNVRIWNYARSQQSVRDSMFVDLTSAPGLLGSYKLNEGSGTTAANTGSAGSAGNGTLVSGVTWVSGTDLSRSNSAVIFDGQNDYIDFGPSTSIGATEFTLECWFKKTGSGTTGAFSPFTAVYPLLAKGRDEETGTTKDANYFLGLLSDGRIAANFEEAGNGDKHSITGVSVVQEDIWYHAAATYDGTYWKLYLNGSLEATDSVGKVPQSASIQHASLGTALNSGGAAEGFFEGLIDNARIWNYARDQQDIVDSSGRVLLAAPGLLANWSLNEAYSDTARNTGSGTVDGRLINGAMWVERGIIFTDDIDTLDNIINDSNWYNPANWMDNEVPYAFTTAYVPAGKKVVLSAGQHGQCKRLINEGTMVVKDGAALSVWGSIVNSGTINGLSGELEFAGTGSDSVSGNAVTVKHFVMNKLGTGNVTLTANISVDSFLSLNNGIVYTASANSLTIRDNAGSSEGSHQSHVDGFMTKVGDDAFVFPLGDNNYWARLGITAPTSATDAFSANRVHAPSANLSSKQSPLKAVSSYEHWNLNRLVGTSGVKVTLYWEDNAVSSISAVSDTDLVVAHYTGSIWVSETQDSRTGTLARGSITSQLITGSFSPFTFGATTTLTALPVELLDFTGKKIDRSVKLSWSTASEIRNDRFVVEKTTDGKSWKEIGTIKGASYSNQVLDYDMFDFSPVAGWQYYRLKQVDLNGRSTYSKRVAVNFAPDAGNVDIYPNPVAGELHVRVPGSEEMVVNIYNSMGKVVYTAVNSNSTYLPIDFSAYEEGMYLLEIIQGDQISKTKIIKY